MPVAKKSAAKAKPKTTTKAPAKKTSLNAPRGNALRLTIDFLVGGSAAVAARIKAENLPVSMVRKAADELSRTHPAKGAEFQAWVDETYPKPINRGLSPPEAGQTRRYKTQETKTSPAFMRLPLSVLGVKKGGPVDVSFENDEIRVRRAPR